MSGYNSYKISEIRHLNDEIFVMAVEADVTVEPGQFFMLREPDTTDPMMGRPISVSDYKDGKLYFLIQIMGKGTEIFSKKQPETKF